MARGLTSVAVLVALCATAGTAYASFPGANGAIVYGWNGSGEYRGAPESTAIRTAEPRGGLVRVLRDCPIRVNAPAPPRHPECGVGAPRYSPDGSRIGLLTSRMSYPPNGPWQFQPGLATMTSGGASFDERPTTYSYQRLAWSPAGDRLLMDRFVDAAQLRSQIFLAALDGTELAQVTANGSSPDWSSKGQIAFTRSREIYVMRLGRSPRRLTRRGGYSPSWSPDGTKLAFVRDKGLRPDLYVIGRGGRGLRRLTRRGYSPAWSPDGRWIAYIRAGDIYVIRSNGRARRRIVDEQWDGLDGPQVVSIDWQPLP